MLKSDWFNADSYCEQLMLISDMHFCVCKQQQSCIRRQQMCNFNVPYSMTEKLHAIGNLTPSNDTLTGGHSDILPFYPLDAPKSF